MGSRGEKKKERKALRERKETIMTIDDAVKLDWKCIIFIMVAALFGYVCKNIPNISKTCPTIYLISNLLVLAVMIAVFVSALPQLKKHKQLEEKCKSDIEKDNYDYQAICVLLSELKYSKISKKESILTKAVATVIFISEAVILWIGTYQNFNFTLELSALIITILSDVISALSIIFAFVYIHVSFRSSKILSVYMINKKDEEQK